MHILQSALNKTWLSPDPQKQIKQITQLRKGLDSFHKRKQLNLTLRLSTTPGTTSCSRPEYSPSVFSLITTISTFSCLVGNPGKLQQSTSEAYKSNSLLKWRFRELTPPPMGVLNPPLRQTLFFFMESMTPCGICFMSPWTWYLSK